MAEESLKSPPALTGQRRSNFWLWAILLGLAALLAIVLFVVDPARNGYFPACQFYRLTGLQCPGCGGLRAAHQLLHGNVIAAFHLNPLFVLFIPLFSGWMLWAWWASRTAGARARLPSIVVYGLLISILVFGIVRNL